MWIKVLRNFKYLSAIGSVWTELSKVGWSAEIPSGVSGRASYLIDGNGEAMGQMCIVQIHFGFVIDMKAAQTFSALGMDYYHARMLLRK